VAGDVLTAGLGLLVEDVDGGCRRFAAAVIRFFGSRFGLAAAADRPASFSPRKKKFFSSGVRT